MTLRLTSVTVAATYPPRRGQQIRTAGILANLGPDWVVDSWSLMIQRTDLPIPRRHHPVSDVWTDHRSFDPLVFGWIAGLGRLGCPPVFVSRVASALPHRLVREAVAAADAVMVESPFPAAWVRSMLPKGTPLVINAHNVETDLYPATSGWRRRAAREIERCEASAFGRADLVLVPSEYDAQRATALAARDVAVIPNGVDLSSYSRAGASARIELRTRLGQAPDRHLAIFVGAAHPPNAEAVDILERQAAAYHAAGVTLVVVGRCGLGRRRVQNVLHVGEVEDVGVYLAGADVGLVPLHSGSGTSFKTLEYLASYLPVVSTPVGARGLGLEPGRDAIICEVDRMPTEVGLLLSDPELRARLVAAGRLAAEPFSWSNIGLRASNELGNLIRRVAPSD